MNYVSWYDAAMYANWATSGNINQGAYDTSAGANWGNSNAGNYTGIDRDQAIIDYGTVYVIPTEDEWYKAAYHKNDGVTGNYFKYPTGSDTRVNNDLIDPDPGNNANFYDSGFTIDSPYYRTEAGEFELSQSPYDTFDMGGNVWEWNETLFGSGELYGLRGGAFDSPERDLNPASEYLLPSAQRANLGFRVASVSVSVVPEPATIGLLGLGGLLLRRRKRA